MTNPPKRLRKPRPLLDENGRILAEIEYSWPRDADVLIVHRPIYSTKIARRLAKWLVRAAAYLEQQKGE